MPTLKQYLLEIKRQKDLYLLPENLRKDVELLGVTGEFEGGSGQVKLFESVSEMNLDEDKEEGNLAVVYKQEIIPLQSTKEFSSCMFDNIVELDSAFTDEIYGIFTMVEQSEYFTDVYCELSPSYFMFEVWGYNNQFRVEYRSDDGITYTRTDGGDETVDIGVLVKFDTNYEEWNPIFGKFIKVDNSQFTGIYQCMQDKNKHLYTFTKNGITVDTENEDITVTHTNTVVTFDIVQKAYEKLYEEYKDIYYWGWHQTNIYTDGENIYIPVAIKQTSRPNICNCSDLYLYDDKLITSRIKEENSGYTYSVLQYVYNVADDTIALDETATIINVDGYLGIDISSYSVICGVEVTGDSGFLNISLRDMIIDYSTDYSASSDFNKNIGRGFIQESLAYYYAPTQLTLKETNHLFVGNKAYGMNGVITGNGILEDITDTTATESDICVGKTAYTDDGKVTGIVREVTSSDTMEIRQVTRNDTDGVLECTNTQPDTIIRNGATQTMTFQVVIDAIGLTANKLAQGTTILGVTGTAPLDNGIGIIHDTSELPEVATEGDIRFHVNNDYSGYYGMYVYTNYEWVLQNHTNILLEDDYNRALETVNEIRNVDQQG